jgi:hypothetical protein
MSKPFKIHVLICTYNDHVLLPLALDSIRDVADSIIIADGAYTKYLEHFLRFDKSVKPWSTDGTLEMLKILQKDLPPIKLIETPNGKTWANQTAKRTALLEAVPDKDWFLILDSDEMFYGDVEGGVNEVMGSGCIAGCMPLFNPGLDMNGLIPVWHPRVFLKLPGMYYERKHWLLCDFAHRVIEHTYPLWMTNQCVLAHFKLFKHHRRMAPHMSYMLDMSKRGWQEPETNIIQSQAEVKQ